ncbi:hypothetical protein EON79_09590 [bacterium]|nr:MAG: hypothetical protein EON79_09590 [bacterium]
MLFRGLAASTILAAFCTMGGGQASPDPLQHWSLQIWADSFDDAKLIGPDGNPAIADGGIATWIPRRGSPLLGSDATLVPNAVANRSAIRLGGHAFVSKENVAIGDRYTILAAFRLQEIDTQQTLLQIGSSDGLTLRLGPDRRLQVWLGGRVTVTSRQRWNVHDHAVVSLVSDAVSTELYIDGSLDIRQTNVAKPTRGILGRLAIGSRLDGSEPTTGDFTGLALYRQPLTGVERRAAEDRLLQSLAIPRETTYVSSVKGSVGAGGLLPSDPVATLEEGIARRTEIGGGTLAVEAPPELPIRGQVTVNASVPLTIKGIGGQRWNMVCATRYTSGWQKTSAGTYRRSWSLGTAQAAWVETLLDEDGAPLALKPAISLSDIQPGQFFLEGGYLNVRLPGEANPNQHVLEVPKLTSCLRIVNPNGSLRIENGTFRGGMQGAVETGQASAGGRVVAKDCIAEYSYCGFKIGGQFSEGIFESCIARRNTNDGFNLHAYAGIRSTMRLTDCEAYRNGDEGASPHDDTEMTVVGGRLHHNDHSGFMAVGNARISLVDLEIDHNGQSGFMEIENGFTAWVNVRGSLLRCNIHHNNGPGIFREYPEGIALTDVLSYDNAWQDQ